MRTSKKIALAALFTIAITGIAFDIARTISTFHSGPQAFNTIWDILEPTIAVIVSTLPTYKALLGRSKRKIPAYENLGSSRNILWNSGHNHGTEAARSIELVPNSENGLKDVSMSNSCEIP